MRPILFEIGHRYVASYSAMMFIAVTAAAVTALLRIRRRTLDGTMLARGMIIAIVLGYATGRAGLWLDGSARDAGFRIVLPTYPAPGSLTYFMLGAGAGLIAFAAIAGKPALQYYDALAPSALIAVGFAKIGCLLGGCCAGGICPAAIGVSYPYGTPAYEQQYRAGSIAVPSLLVRPGDHAHDTPFWGEMQLMSLQPQFLADRVEKAGFSRGATNVILAAARGQHSLPVWPVPAAMSMAAFALWIGAEYIFRNTRRTGTTVAFVLVAYGVLRLTFDWYIAQRGTLYDGMTIAQWAGLCALGLGAAVHIISSRRSRRAY